MFTPNISILNPDEPKSCSTLLTSCSFCIINVVYQGVKELILPDQPVLESKPIRRSALFAKQMGFASVVRVHCSALKLMLKTRGDSNGSHSV
jgi:hypothetical protein